MEIKLTKMEPITEETYDACWECGGMGEIVLNHEKCITERCSSCGGSGEKTPRKTEKND